MIFSSRSQAQGNCLERPVAEKLAFSIFKQIGSRVICSPVGKFNNEG